jgi:hypothetical protein
MVKGNYPKENYPVEYYRRKGYLRINCQLFCFTFAIDILMLMRNLLPKKLIIPIIFVFVGYNCLAAKALFDCIKAKNQAAIKAYAAVLIIAIITLAGIVIQKL